MDTRHHRRFIVLELGIVRQILGEMPDQARGRRDTHQEQHGSSGEQETDKTDKQSHKSYPVVSPPSVRLRPIQAISIRFNCVRLMAVTGRLEHQT